MDDALLQLGVTQRPRALLASTSYVQRTSPSFYVELAGIDKRQVSLPYVTHVLPLGVASPSLLSYADDGWFRVHDTSTLQVQSSFTWQSGGAVTSLQSFVGGFVASGRQGVVGLWDERRQSTFDPALTLAAPSHSAYLSSAVAGEHIVAAGTELHSSDASIDIWDIRQPSQPVLTYKEAHSDDVTALSFHPSVPSVLLSASSDALVAISDIRQADEDDSVLGVINTGASVARAGWGGSSQSYAKAEPVDGEDTSDAAIRNAALPGLGAFYSVSDMQTLGVWEADGFTELLPVRDVRNTLSTKGESSAWRTEYVIDASVESSLLEGTEGVGLFCGDQTGAMALIEASCTPADGDAASAEQPWSLHCLTSGGHDEVVRCVSWDAHRQILYSGAEDGRICAWSLSDTHLSNEPSLLAQQDVSMGSAVGPARKPLRGSGTDSPRERAGKPY